jgi:hypothetical protein
MPQVIVLPWNGDVAYRNFDYMVGCIGRGFERLGFTVRYLDLQRQSEILSAFDAFLGGSCAAYVTLHSYGFSPRLYSEILKSRHIRQVYLSTDHPYGSLATLVDLPKEVLVAYPTRRDLEIARLLAPGGPTFECIAHAAELRPARSWAERDIPVVLAATLHHRDPEAYRGELCRESGIPEELIEIMLFLYEEGDDQPLGDIARNAWAIADRDGTTPDGSSLLALCQAFDLYMRCRLRIEMVQSLGKGELMLVGPGWDGIAPPSARQIGAVDGAALRALYDRAKIVVNIYPKYMRSQERAFEAMAGGSLALSTGSGYLVNADPEAAEHDAIGYLHEKAPLGDQLQAWLGDDDRLAAAASAGRQQCGRFHTYEHRLAGVARWLAMD